MRAANERPSPFSFCSSLKNLTVTINSDSAGETWQAVHDALYHGQRGLSSGSSLARFLAEKRGVRNIQGLPRLTIRQILKWARAHRQETGTWPKRTAGPIVDAPGETWDGVYQALYKGLRGLPPGTSLPQMLQNQELKRIVHQPCR
jgi:hypothetical protein